MEKRAFHDLIASSSLKTKKIRLVEKPIADALGAGLDVMDATGRLIVNIGADTTEISLISLGGIVQSRLLKIGGTRFDEAIQQAVKKKHNLVIGMTTAATIFVNGRVTSLKRTLTDTSSMQITVSTIRSILGEN